MSPGLTVAAETCPSFIEPVIIQLEQCRALNQCIFFFFLKKNKTRQTEFFFLMFPSKDHLVLCFIRFAEEQEKKNPTTGKFCFCYLSRQTCICRALRNSQRDHLHPLTCPTLLILSVLQTDKFQYASFLATLCLRSK